MRNGFDNRKTLNLQIGGGFDSVGGAGGVKPSNVNLVKGAQVSDTEAIGKIGKIMADITKSSSVVTADAAKEFVQ
jgi:hypothetical protein